MDQTQSKYSIVIFGLVQPAETDEPSLYEHDPPLHRTSKEDDSGQESHTQAGFTRHTYLHL